MARRSDMALGFAGFAMAAAAAWFPWHVYVTPEQFGPPRMAFERVGPPVQPSAQETLDAHMAAYEDMLRGVPVASLAPVAGIDMTVTGSVNNHLKGAREKRLLPVPEVVVATPGRALVRQNGVLELWQVGSRAEDGRRVVSIGQEDGRIIVRLDDGTALEPAPRKAR